MRAVKGGGTGPSKGMALAVVLLLLLALTALGNGMLLMAQRELEAARALRHAIRAGQASEGALRLALGEDRDLAGGRPLRVGIPVASGEMEGGFEYDVIRRWLDAEYFLLEAEGGSRGWPGRRRSGWVGWSLHPGVRIASLNAMAEVGGRLIAADGSGVEAGPFLDPPDGWSEGVCEAYRRALDTLFVHGPPPPLGPLPDGTVEEPTPGDDIPGLGLLSGAHLLERAGRGGAGALQSGPPGASQGCPPGEDPAFFGTEGSLTVAGKHVCGLLAVGGDLSLVEGARLQGVALVGGTLRVAGSAALEGMARVGGDLQLEGDGRFVGSGCPVVRALEGIEILREPLLLTGDHRINGF